MAKYTDEQIKKALELIASGIGGAKRDLCIASLDLINRQEVEIAELNIELRAMRGAANSYKMECERLITAIAEAKVDLTSLKEETKADFAKLRAEANEAIKSAKSEAIKEFAEILKNRLLNTEHKRTNNSKYVTAEELTNTVNWVLHGHVIRIVDETKYGMVGESKNGNVGNDV